MTTPARARYAGYRFPAEIISHAVWLYFRFPLGLRMVEELQAARAARRPAMTTLKISIASRRHGRPPSFQPSSFRGGCRQDLLWALALASEFGDWHE
jgi:hypothetical protein